MKKLLFLLVLCLTGLVSKIQAQSRCYDASSDCNRVPHESRSYVIEAKCGDTITLLATRELCNTWSQNTLTNATFNVDSSEAYIVIDSITSQLLYIVYGFTDGPTGSCLTDFLYTISIIRDTIYTSTVSCDSSLDGTSQIVYESSNVCDSVVITTFTYTPLIETVWKDTCSNTSVGTDTLSFISQIGGCDSIVIVKYHVLPLPQLDIVQHPSCGGPTEVELFPWGSTAPYHIYWSNGSNDEVRSFSDILWTDVTITDGLGCRMDTSIYIEYWENPTVRLGDDIVANLGDQITVTANHSPGEIHWNHSAMIDQTNLPVGSSLEFVAVHNSEISVMVIDTNGCTASDTLIVRVSADYDVFIPSAFSPNHDGINDTFHVFAGENVSSIKELNIFDRWGNMVFQGLDLAPNDPTQSWDGTYKGQEMDPGVYVYMAKIRFIDGEIHLFKGDITLVR